MKTSQNNNNRNKLYKTRKLLSKRYIVSIGTLILLFTLTLPAHADIAVKFLGDIEPNNLSPKYDDVVKEFFDDDPTNLGFNCFQGDLLGLQNGWKVGVGVDCLNVTGKEDGAEIDAITFFFFPGGHIVNSGKTTVRAFFSGVGDGDGSPGEGSVTHLTGSIPGELPTIVDASGKFSKLVDKGNVRLSGAVDLSLPNSIFFSCLFVIQNGPGRAGHEKEWDD